MNQNGISPIRLGFIGAGRFARTLVEVAAKLPEFRPVAICDAIPERSERLAHEFGMMSCETVARLIERDDVDAVVISTSHDMHAPHTIEAAQAGKHIFCEKPMAIEVADCQAMIDAAARHHVRLMIGQVTRMLPMMRRVRRIVDDGIIGEPVAMHMLRASWMERHGWWAKTASSGGLLYSHGAHMYDLMNSFFGQPASVYAAAAPRIQPQVDFDDTIFTTVIYESGVVGTVGASVSGESWVYRGGILADGGSLQFDLALEVCSLTCQPRGGKAVTETFGTFDEEGVEGVTAELENFAEVIARGASPFVTNDDAMLAVATIQAAYESLRTGSAARVSVGDSQRSA